MLRYVTVILKQRVTSFRIMIIVISILDSLFEIIKYSERSDEIVRVPQPSPQLHAFEAHRNVTLTSITHKRIWSKYSLPHMFLLSCQHMV
jgi:hypothetical protein